MDYDRLSKKELLEIIKDLEALNKQLLEEKEQEIYLDFQWTSNLGHWYWSIKTNTVKFNPLKVTTLGYTNEEIPNVVPYQFFTNLLHKDDYENTMNAMRMHMQGKASVYETEYRIKTKSGSYKWYYDIGKITQRDLEGNPLIIAGIVFDITERKEREFQLKEKNKLLEKEACTDGLTRIRNHKSIIECLEKEIDRVNQNKKFLFINLFDIDDFKKINDSKGHQFGDQVLYKVAEIINQNIREIDYAGRYGGEEFLVIFPNVDLNEVKVICENVRISIKDYFDNRNITLTVSGGLDDYKGTSCKEFINRADKNLYKAKSLGKNRILY